MPSCGGCASPAEYPCGGRKPDKRKRRFHPFVKPIPNSGRKISGGQTEHPLMATVLPLRARNAAIRGCSACRELCRIGERMNVR
ncbi:MAG: hypothetical protein LBK61_11750 [Spirochaetaceae bacterium]|nr:hypothetical protein [Spirochaetaceae bacterium]